MAAIISALDNYTPSQLGENSSREYTWSNNYQEKIVQLHFQLTRTQDEKQISNLAMQTDKLLQDLTAEYRCGILQRELYLEYMSVLYRIIGHTRDIINGKGEYTLAYMLLGVWDSLYPELAEFALKQFVLSPEGEKDFHPYGSWKDIKYLYKFDPHAHVAYYGFQLMNTQLRDDIESDKPSLVAKWIPREKSHFGEIFTILATDYFQEYLNTAKTDDTKQKAIKKCKMEYRKLLSSMNKKIDTVQIKQCGQNWSDIDPLKQTSITMHKQKRAFLNVNKVGTPQSESLDRIECAEHFREFVKKAVKGEVDVKGKRIGLNHFVSDALSLIRNHRELSDEADLLNLQWLDNTKQNGALGKMIAMVDVSGSMMGDPLHSAVALGIRVAEKSMLGKRVMTFSSAPVWVNLSSCNNFIEMVDAITHSEWGMNTNIFSAFKMILDVIIIQKMPAEDCEDMVLAIFSDMQVDQADSSYDSLMHQIEEMYMDAGIRICGKPYKPPHILFWNLRSTSGFPSLSTQRNVSMMSGFNPSLLNLFCEEGLNALHSCTPWSLLVTSLENERYDILDKKIRAVL